MKNIILIFTGLLFLTGCEAEDIIDKVTNPSEAQELEAGTYLSECSDAGGDGQQVTVVLGADGSRSTEVRQYAGDLSCTSTGSVVDSNVGTYTESGVDMLGASYLESTDDSEPGVIDYLPFSFDGTTLYIGDSVTDISSGAESVFAEFVLNPAANSELILTLQE